MSEFSNKLKQLRWSLNMSRKKFSKTLGINESTYAGYENDRRKPSAYFLKMLVVVYHIDLNEWILEM